MNQFQKFQKPLNKRIQKKKKKEIDSKAILSVFNFEIETCVTDFRMHPWIDASKPPSNSIFKALQKRQLGLRVKNIIRNNAWDLFCRDFGYRGKLSKDLRFLKDLKAHGNW